MYSKSYDVQRAVDSFTSNVPRACTVTTSSSPQAFDREVERFLVALEPLRLPFRAGGTFAPFFRASERPIATACLRLFTFPPRPDFPRRSVPRFRRPIALFTLLLAPLLYFRPLDLREDAFFAAIEPPSGRGVLILESSDERRLSTPDELEMRYIRRGYWPRQLETTEIADAFEESLASAEVGASQRSKAVGLC